MTRTLSDLVGGDSAVLPSLHALHLVLHTLALLIYNITVFGVIQLLPYTAHVFIMPLWKTGEISEQHKKLSIKLAHDNDDDDDDDDDDDCLSCS